MHLLALLLLITLEEFGTTPNQNQTVQPDARFNPNQPLRTNDFQPLQQVNATERQIVRMGAFYISQGPEGPGVTLPASQTDTGQAVTTPIDDVRWIFGSPGTTFNRLTNFETTQAMTVRYYPVGDFPPATDDVAETIVDYNIIGNAYHDIRYNGVVPQITIEGTIINRVQVDETLALPLQTSGPIRPGQKFKFIMENGQTFLLYTEQGGDLSLRTTLDINNNQTILTASQPFTGFVRLAAIVPNAPFGTFTTTGLSTDWSSAIVQQTSPPSPMSMFMLWPISWLEAVGPLIRNRIQEPGCQIVQELLPILARTDFDSASTIFRQLNSQNVLKNPFLTFFNIVIARDLSAQIAAYQAGPGPISNPFNATAIEAALDAQRSIIPISCDVEFTSNQHSWTYETFSGTDPLILFPSYKTLSAIPPLPGVGYADAVKGPLFASPAFANQIFFSQTPIPSFPAETFDLIQYFPASLNIRKTEASQLGLLFRFLTPQLVTATDVVGAGSQVFNIAVTAKNAVFLLSRDGAGKGLVKALTEPLINEVKQTLTSWLVTFDIPDHFTADTTTGGICASAGMGASAEQTSSVDDGNAIYNDHHFQYGFWLAAIAFVVEWDEIFNTTVPWIAANKDRADMLWRDARNFSKVDPELPFNRHGNPWEGHSTQNGARYTVLADGRLQERFGQDFASWLATLLYARAMLASSAVADKTGYTELATFAQTNMQMTAESATLVFQSLDSINLTAGTITDTSISAETTLEPGSGCSVAP